MCRDGQGLAGTLRLPGGKGGGRLSPSAGPLALCSRVLYRGRVAAPAHRATNTGYILCGAAEANSGSPHVQRGKQRKCERGAAAAAGSRSRQQRRQGTSGAARAPRRATHRRAQEWISAQGEGGGQGAQQAPCGTDMLALAAARAAVRVSREVQRPPEPGHVRAVEGLPVQAARKQQRWSVWLATPVARAATHHAHTRASFTAHQGVVVTTVGITREG
jgi:hypothetical protein